MPAKYLVFSNRHFSHFIHPTHYTCDVAQPAEAPHFMETTASIIRKKLAEH